MTISPDRDHTRIELTFDPTIDRMDGFTSHTGEYFNVPYISEIAENLWMGGCTDGLILPKHIINVVSLYPWESYTVNHNLMGNVSIRMYDDESVPVDRYLVESLGELANDLSNYGPTLIHCQAGLNRSGLITSMALIARGYAPQQAINLIRERRSPACLCNQTFREFVLNTEGDRFV